MKAIGAGDVVVCVDADLSPSPPWIRLRNGARYIVRAVVEGRSESTGDVGPAILLCGIVNAPGVSGKEYAYAPEQFRPIGDGDAAIFRRMIERPKVEA